MVWRKNYDKQKEKIMYRVDRNNFYKEPKKATIYTPAPLSNFIYDGLTERLIKIKPY